MGTFYGFIDNDQKHHYLALPTLERAQGFLSMYLKRIAPEVRATYDGVQLFSYPLHRNEIIDDYLHPEQPVLLEHALRPRVNREAIVTAINAVHDQQISIKQRMQALTEVLDDFLKKGWLRTPIDPVIRKKGKRNYTTTFRVRAPAITIMCTVEIDNSVQSQLRQSKKQHDAENKD